MISNMRGEERLQWPRCVGSLGRSLLWPSPSKVIGQTAIGMSRPSTTLRPLAPTPRFPRAPAANECLPRSTPPSPPLSHCDWVHRSRSTATQARRATLGRNFLPHSVTGFRPAPPSTGQITSKDEKNTCHNIYRRRRRERSLQDGSYACHSNAYGRNDTQARGSGNHGITT